VFDVEAPWGWPQFIWRFALIWILGLLTIGAPAGLGVREALLVVWFSLVIGESRVVTTVADVRVFGLAWLSDAGPGRSDDPRQL
jgi:hypothetical protein